MNQKLTELISNLKANNFLAEFVETADDAVKKVLSLIPKGSTVAAGGSMTLVESGIIEAIEDYPCNYLQRPLSASPSELTNYFAMEKTCDYYLTSANAVTYGGELYNVDGRANRVSAIANGPKNVIVVVGINKLTENLDGAVRRVKEIAAPQNAKRLGLDTYCALEGKCVSLKNASSAMTDGCNSDSRICCNYLICARQRVKNRISVIIVGESLGY